MTRDVRPPRANLTQGSYLTSHEVAHYLQVNPSSVNKWVKEDRIPAHRTPGGHRRIRVSDLVDFLAKYRMPIPTELLPESDPAPTKKTRKR